MKNNEVDYKIKKTPVLLKPYFFIKPSVSAVSIRMLVMLSIQLLLLIATNSYSALVVIIASTLGAVLANLFNFVYKKVKAFTMIPILIQGIVIGMLLPQTFPPVVACFISFMVLFIEHLIFSGNSQSWVNGVCVAVIVAWFVGSTYFPALLVNQDIVTLKNPVSYLSKNGLLPVYDFDSSICQVLNSTVLYWFKVTLPEGIISFLWDSQSAIPAFRFTFITIISSVFLFADNGFSPIIPSILLFVFGILIRFLLPVINNAPMFQGDLILAFCNSGVIFCAVFIIQWFGTNPITISGKIIYGIITGIIAFLVMGYGTSSIGMCYTVLICNVINLLIRFVEDYQNEKKVNALFVQTEENKEAEE